MWQMKYAAFGLLMNEKSEKYKGLVGEKAIFLGFGFPFLELLDAETIGPSFQDVPTV